MKERMNRMESLVQFDSGNAAVGGVKDRRRTAEAKTKRKDVYVRKKSRYSALPGNDEGEHDAVIGVLVPVARLVARERRSPDLDQTVRGILDDTH
jgi:hypothetical protein